MRRQVTRLLQKNEQMAVTSKISQRIIGELLLVFMFYPPDHLTDREPTGQFAPCFTCLIGQRITRPSLPVVTTPPLGNVAIAKTPFR